MALRGRARAPHETGHRIKAIQHLRWSDVDLELRTVTWQAEHDKTGQAHVTPLTDEAVAILKKARKQVPPLGDGWVLPSPRNADEPCSRHVVYKWLKKGLHAIGLGDRKRLGYHASRRKFATDYKAVAMRDLMQLGGSKDAKPITGCSQQADLDAMRRAQARRGQSTHQSTHRGAVSSWRR